MKFPTGIFVGAASVAIRRPETAFAPDGAPTEDQPPAEVQPYSCRIGKCPVCALGEIQGNDRTFSAPARRSSRSFALKGWRRRNAGDRGTRVRLISLPDARPGRATLFDAARQACCDEIARLEHGATRVGSLPGSSRVPRRRLSFCFIVAGVAPIHRHLY